MKVYVTRHGQVDLKAKYWNGDVTLPVGEVVLSELGEQQAVLLGKRLREVGFRGKILASPLLRTMRTAELIAKETGSEIWPTAWMHEIFSGAETLQRYRGYTLTELKSFYACVSKEAVLEYPWWPKVTEDNDTVYARVSQGIARLLEEQSEEEVLLVGHGASVAAAHRYLELGGEHTWNCCLGMYDSEHPQRNYGRDVSFFPPHMVSSNVIMATDVDFGKDFPKFYKIDVPQKLRMEKRPKLLHIGNTCSEHYYYYKQLINAVKPAVIIHTGNMAEDIGSEETEQTKEKYSQIVCRLLDILKNSESHVYWVPGDKDKLEVIAQKASFIEKLEPDTVLHIEGTKVCIGYTGEADNERADIYLYSCNQNGKSVAVKDGENNSCYWNTIESSRVYVFETQEMYTFKLADAHA